MKPTLIIPILNESLELPTLFENLKNYPKLPIIFCDGGSTDGSQRIIREMGYRLIEDRLEINSVWNTIRLAKNKIETDYLLIHPVDVKLLFDFETFESPEEREFEGDYAWFDKQYEPRKEILNFQAFLLNSLRSRKFKNFVWTNAPLIRTSIFNEILGLKRFQQNIGFLEDIVLSDYLKKHYEGSVLKGKVSVSARRYLKDGALKRILGNLKILMLFRFAGVSPQTLKKQYS